MNQLFITIEMSDSEIRRRILENIPCIKDSFDKYLMANSFNRISHIPPRINRSKVRALPRTMKRTIRSRRDVLNNMRSIKITKNRR